MSLYFKLGAVGMGTKGWFLKIFSQWKFKVLMADSMQDWRQEYKIHKVNLLPESLKERKQ